MFQQAEKKYLPFFAFYTWSKKPQKHEKGKETTSLMRFEKRLKLPNRLSKLIDRKLF